MTRVGPSDAHSPSVQQPWSTDQSGPCWTLVCPKLTDTNGCFPGWIPGSPAACELDGPRPLYPMIPLHNRIYRIRDTGRT